MKEIVGSWSTVNLLSKCGGQSGLEAAANLRMGFSCLAHAVNIAKGQSARLANVANAFVSSALAMRLAIS